MRKEQLTKIFTDVILNSRITTYLDTSSSSLSVLLARELAEQLVDAQESRGSIPDDIEFHADGVKLR